jgi:hypothetical protein
VNILAPYPVDQRAELLPSIVRFMLPVDFPSGRATDLTFETGPEGNNGVFYGALSGGAIGSLFPFTQDTVTYHFISDGRIPEPASLLLLVSGFVSLVAWSGDGSVRTRSFWGTFARRETT